MDILRISKPEWIVVGIGCVMSVIMGAADVFLSVLQTNMITVSAYRQSHVCWKR